MAQPLKKEESKEKNVQKGLDNNGNIEGIFIFRLPGSPRDFQVREVGEGASVKADEELD